MKATSVLMAGFGGQGMLLAGKALAQAAMAEGLQVSWLPSYGPEMRGGTANVIVCVSKDPIASPLVSRPDALLAMNLPSLDRFEASVAPGGTIVVNATLVARACARDDCRVVRVDARALAQAAGSERAANFVMLGAYVGATALLPTRAAETAIADEFRDGRERHIAANVLAFRAGVEAGSANEVQA
ncbi:MAG TPA: 2-oxoacid:acceptor oxidoreductase family protein [Planctomycetota bacterium]|nr:2-oxoacid:acceptor oxidoreductase family protein [Planctomycetota bacterium]